MTRSATADEVNGLLVVAGEASGDRAAAAVLAKLASRVKVRAFGMGGEAMAEAGAELVSDLRASTAMGVGEVVRRGFAIAMALERVLRAARGGARAALLVNYSEFNAHLAVRLHARGVRVLWYGAPQIWAWRAGRAPGLRRAIDRMAVILPFEEALWRGYGVDAHYVGHPARELTPMSRAEAKRALALTPHAKAVAILPGSRPHEVRRLLEPMLEGFERIRRDRASIDARVLLAPSLDDATRRHVIQLAKAARVAVVDVEARLGAGALLGGFDAALCASGTAALEATLARAVPVIVYKVGLVTEIAARGLVRTPFYALPNVLLRRAAFTELLQRDVRPKSIARALARALDDRGGLLAACDEVEASLGPRRTPSLEVAEMLLPWLLPSGIAERGAPRAASSER